MPVGGSEKSEMKRCSCVYPFVAQYGRRTSDFSMARFNDCVSLDVILEVSCLSAAIQELGASVIR